MYLVQIDVLSLYPFIESILNPINIHNFEVQAVLRRILVFGSIDVSYDQVSNVRSQIGLEDGAHLRCLVHDCILAYQKRLKSKVTRSSWSRPVQHSTTKVKGFAVAAKSKSISFYAIRYDNDRVCNAINGILR